MTHTQLRTDRAVRVVAHRGASHEHPEHTLAAYRQAIADGADAWSATCG